MVVIPTVAQRNGGIFGDVKFGIKDFSTTLEMTDVSLKARLK